MKLKNQKINPAKAIKKWMERFMAAFVASAVPFMVVSTFIEDTSKVHPMIEEIMKPARWYLFVQTISTLLVTFVLFLVMHHLKTVEKKNAQQFEEPIHPGEAA